MEGGNQNTFSWLKQSLANLLGYKLPTQPPSLVNTKATFNELHTCFDKLTSQWTYLRSLPETHKRIQHLKKLEAWTSMVRARQLNIVIKKAKYGS